jgi:Cobalamin biosynthesis protein CobN and related Mg-chelatases
MTGTRPVLLLSTADTELLAARGSGALYRTANPARVEPAGLPALLDGVSMVVLRLLGGHRTWPEGVDALVASGLPVVLLGGEATPDAELMAASTVPAGVVSEALGYLAAGGLDNLRELHRFLSDTVLLTGEGFEPPAAAPEFGVHGDRALDPARPTVGVVFYRAHELSGNTAFVETLCDAIEARGANALPVFCGTLRGADPELMALLGRADALVATVLAAGGTRAADASAAEGRGGSASSAEGRGGSAYGEEDAWDAGALATLDVPVLQGLCLTTSRETWAGSDAALSPMDAAMQVAIPEFDGRLITVPFSFKETLGGGDDSIPVYRADPERAARLAGLAVRHARLGSTPVAARKLAVVLSSYPTKHARVGNAVGLDTPASAVVLLRALRAAGYTVGEFPGDVSGDSDELIHTLIAAGGHDVEWLTEEQLRGAPSRVRLEDYRRWFDALPAALTDGIREHWGDAARLPLRGWFRHRARGPAVRKRAADDPAAARVRREPGGDLPRPRAAALAPLPRRLPLAGARVRGRRGDPPRQARHAGVAAGQGPRALGGVRPGRGARRAAAGLPVHRQRPR